MTKSKALELFGNENYKHAKYSAHDALLTARDFIHQMQMETLHAGMTNEDWQAFNDCEKMYDNLSKMMTKLIDKF